MQNNRPSALRDAVAGNAIPSVLAAAIGVARSRAPETFDRRVGHLTRIAQRVVSRPLEIAPRAVRGGGQARYDAFRLTLVSAQDRKLRSRFITKLANPTPGVCLDLPLRVA